MTIKDLYEKISLETEAELARQRGKRESYAITLDNAPRSATPTAVVIQGVPTVRGTTHTLIAWFAIGGLRVQHAISHREISLHDYSPAVYARVIAIHRANRNNGATCVTYTDH